MNISKNITWIQRFDFGVPLEDIFPPNDIHPRLKFLFEKCLETTIASGLSTDNILRNSQESLETRLRLKEKLIHEINYQKGNNFLPGTYLWLIRHFLGLLPIPLIPEYSNKMSFEWNRLSDQCQDYLKYGRSFKEDSYILDYFIVEGLSFLPIEHLTLLNYLMIFMRKIITKSSSNLQRRKRNLLVLAKYFCGSIFSRPYRPGYKEKSTDLNKSRHETNVKTYQNQKEILIKKKLYTTNTFIDEIHSMALELHSLDITDITCYNGRAIFRQLQNKPVIMLPLLIYFLLKWHEIREICIDTGIIEYYRTPDINENIRLKDNIDLLKIHTVEEKCLDNYYLKDTSAQTETQNVLNMSSQTSLQQSEINLLDTNLNEKSSQTDTIPRITRSSQTTRQNWELKVLNKSAQTDSVVTTNTSSQTISSPLSGNIENGNETNNLEETFPLANSTAFPSDDEANESFWSPNKDLFASTSKYYSILTNNEFLENNENIQDSSSLQGFAVRGKDESELLDEISCSLFTNLDKGNEWSEIVDETERTVKKIEEYIYDDYDTFAKEEFNQIFEEKSPQEEKKDSKRGWANIFTNLNPNNKKSKNLESIDENSFIRFDDVNDLVFNSSGFVNTDATRDSNSDPLPRSSFNSEEVLYDYSKDKSSMYKETKSKINFGLKRFKLKMNFLRLLTPKNAPNRSLMDGYFQNRKYEKIIDTKAKANTL